MLLFFLLLLLFVSGAPISVSSSSSSSSPPSWPLSQSSALFASTLFPGVGRSSSAALLFWDVEQQVQILNSHLLLSSSSSYFYCSGLSLRPHSGRPGVVAARALRHASRIRLFGQLFALQRLLSSSASTDIAPPPSRCKRHKVSRKRKKAHFYSKTNIFFFSPKEDARCVSDLVCGCAKRLCRLTTLAS